MKGKRCIHFHPKICPPSLSERCCNQPGCSLLQVTGTKRKAENQTKNTMESITPNERNPRSRQQQTTENSPSF